MKYTTIWCDTQLLQTHISSLLQYCVGYQNINLTSLCYDMYKQPLYYLYTAKNQIFIIMFIFLLFLTLIIFTIYY